MRTLHKISNIMQLLNEYDSIKKQYQQRLKNEGWQITAPQVGVMRIINLYPGISISQLAKKMNIHITTAEGFSERLSTLGYVEVKRAEEDLRKKVLHLTENGEQILEQIPLGFKSLLHYNLTNEVSDEELDKVEKGLELLIHYMGKNTE